MRCFQMHARDSKGRPHGAAATVELSCLTTAFILAAHRTMVPRAAPLSALMEICYKLHRTCDDVFGTLIAHSALRANGDNFISHCDAKACFV